MEIGPLGWDMGLEAGIWVLRLGGGTQEEEKEKSRKSVRWSAVPVAPM